MARKKLALEVAAPQLTIEVQPEVAVVCVPELSAPIVPPAAPSRWRILETKRVSWYGHLTVLHAGVEISVSEYGPDGIARLREQGLKLEPMV